MTNAVVDNPAALQALLQTPGSNGAPQPIPFNASASRTVYYYSIPAKLADAADGVTKVGLVKLTPSEELANTEQFAMNPMRMVLSNVQASLRVIVRNGQRINVAPFDGTVEVQWAQLDPIIRNLIQTAYGALHSAKPEDIDAFLASCEVTAG